MYVYLLLTVAALVEEIAVIAYSKLVSVYHGNLMKGPFYADCTFSCQFIDAEVT